MAKPFFEEPILNSPYEVPTRHHALDKEGQPLDQPPIQGRRRSELITPVPKSKKQSSKADQTDLTLGDDSGLSSAEQAYTTGRLINESLFDCLAQSGVVVGRRSRCGRRHTAISTRMMGVATQAT